MADSFADYATPPVIEVVCAVTFSPLHGFKAVHLGEFWGELKSEFPRVEEHSPIAGALEQFGAVMPPPSPQLAFVETPPLPRIWFVDEAGNGIIQIQRDTLIHNWRRLSATDVYPRFRVVIEEFKRHLEHFRSFLDQRSLGSIEPVQCELTYVNHIPQGALWSQAEDVGKLFPDFAWRNKKARFLPVYEAMNWRTAFRLPENSGRLHVSLNSAIKREGQEPVLILELKARGLGQRGYAELSDWFDLAHEWIVRGFADLTSEQAQTQLWGLKQ